MLSKNKVLIREIINKFHPEFVASKELRDTATKHPDFFNVEKIVERTLAEVGPYNFIDGDHCDYDDGTDCKTASIRMNPKKFGCSTHSGEISGVTTASGSLKMGGLRCIIYNPHTDNLRYYFLPRDFWQQNITYHPTSKIGKITYSYNSKTGQIPKFNGYECLNFEHLATKVDYTNLEIERAKQRFETMPALYTFSRKVSEKIMNKQYPIYLSKEESNELSAALKW